MLTNRTDGLEEIYPGSVGKKRDEVVKEKEEGQDEQTNMQ